MKPIIHPILTVTFLIQLLPGVFSLLYAGDTTVLISSKNEYPIGNSISFFEDTGCSLTIEDISADHFRKMFTKVTQPSPNFGFSRSVFWLRFSLDNKCTDNSFWILEITNEALSYITLYSGPSYDSATGRKTGRAKSFPTRPISGRGFLFDLPIPSGKTCTCYLRIQSQYCKPVPITVHSAPLFIKTDHTYHLAAGIGYGALLMMIILHLYLFFKLLHRQNLYISIYHFGFIGFHSALSGIAAEYLWPFSPWWNGRSLHFFASIMCIFAHFYLMEFLHTKTMMPRLHRYLKATLTMSFMQCFASIALPVPVMIICSSISGITVTISFIIISLYSRLSGSKPSLFLFLAWLIFFLSLCYFFAVIMQVAPFSMTLSMIAHYSSVLIAILFSIAFARQLFENEKEIESSRELLAHTEKLATIGTLTASVAHEINNPNAALSLSLKTQQQAWGMIEPILDRYSDEHGDFEVGGFTWREFREELRLSLSRAGSNAKRIKKIVADLRAFSRQDEGSFEESINVNSVINDSLTLVGNLIKKRTGKLNLKLGPDIPRVKGNHQQLEQVIINLLQNAAQALESPDRAITVTTSFDDSDNRIALTVYDEGKGMDAKTLRHIFDPFFTTKDVKEGTGLGLSICKRIIDAHKGKLLVESAVGEGTRVSVYLPGG